MQVDCNYGISWNDPVPLDSDSDCDMTNHGVEVPQVPFQLNEDRVQELLGVLHLDPLNDDGNFGINNYCVLLDYIASNPALMQ